MLPVRRSNSLLDLVLTPWDRDFFADLDRFAAGALTTSWKPAVDVRQTEQAYVVSVDLPGVDPADVDVELKDGVLTVSGERQHKSTTEKGGYQRVERFHGRFSRSFTLPEGVDGAAITAGYEHGVLEITVPKPQAVAPQKIAIEGVERREAIEGESHEGEPREEEPIVTATGATSA